MKPRIESKTLMTHEVMQQTLFEMWKIRAFEEKLVELAEEGHIYGTFHLSIGQEGTAVGACSTLRKTDLMTSTHRNHAHSLAKGVDAYRMFAELMAKQTGCNKGKGGSMHISDMTVGALGSNGIVAGGLPIGCGAALASQMNKSGQVVISFLGDGATNEGAFHETLNLASIWKLPIVFFVENNKYGMSSDVSRMVNIAHLSDRAFAYGIPGITIDGNDVEQVMSTTKEAVDFARKGQGPTLIEAVTYRHHGHSKSDQLAYRTVEEEEAWKNNNDPISRFEQKMKDQKEFSEIELREIEKNAREMMEACVKKAMSDSSTSLDELYKDVYAGEIAKKFTQEGGE